MRQAFADFRSLAAVLFALLLFVQFGNEWAIAGWLPLFLIQRLGISPESSLMLLAAYGLRWWSDGWWPLRFCRRSAGAGC